MTRDGAEEDGNAGRVALAAAGDGGERRKRVDVGEVEPPREKALERGLGRGGDAAALEGADHGDTGRARIEAARVRADDVSVDSSEAALVDGPVPVDEVVVTDVVPTVRLHVVDLDSAHDRGCLGRRVAVRARRVVHDREPDRGRVLRPVAADGLVGAPGGTRHDRR